MDKTLGIYDDQLTDKQRVFQSSRVNGAPYYGDQLPEWRWSWPRDTYLQRRMAELQIVQGSRVQGFNRNESPATR